MEYDKYLKLCQDAGLEPVPLDGQFETLQAISALDPRIIPYIGSTGTVWAHDTRHKTKRRDRPFVVANMEALHNAPPRGG